MNVEKYNFDTVPWTFRVESISLFAIRTERTKSTKSVKERRGGGGRRGTLTWGKISIRNNLCLPGHWTESGMPSEPWNVAGWGWRRALRTTVVIKPSRSPIPAYFSSTSRTWIATGVLSRQQFLFQHKWSVIFVSPACLKYSINSKKMFKYKNKNSKLLLNGIMSVSLLARVWLSPHKRP